MNKKNVLHFTKNCLLALLLVSAVQVVFAGPTLRGDDGTHRTYSAKTLGHMRMAIGFSGNGSQDENKLIGGRFYHHQYGFDTNAVEAGQVYDIRRDSLDDSTNITELMDLSSRFFLTLGITNYFDLGVSIPFYFDRLNRMDQSGNDDLANANAFGMGDIEIMGKLQYPPYPHDSTWEMALMGIVTLPTGDQNKGFIPKQIYYIPKDSAAQTRFWSAQLPTVTLMWLNTLDFSQLNPFVKLMWHMNVGMQATASELLDNSFLLSSSLVYRVADPLSFFLEFAGETRLSKFQDGFSLGDDPLLMSAGAVLHTPQGVEASLALDWGISQGVSETLILDADPGPGSNDPLCPNCTGDGRYTSYRAKPAARLGISATISWTGFIVPQDSDGDGILDKYDACPHEPEDFDGYMDHDGCPDPDNDEDGIPDLEDKCPMEPEDFDGFEDEDGCPDPDNDGDGICDPWVAQQGLSDKYAAICKGSDKCPNKAEDFDGFQDEDGCPDADNDGDGICDPWVAELQLQAEYAAICIGVDMCPMEPEDKDGFEDEDGCPDPDNDGDGICDPWVEQQGLSAKYAHICKGSDKCPLAPETINGFEDDDGCPDEKPKPKPVMKQKARIVLHGVNFTTGSAQLTEDSYPKLAIVAETLKDNPEVVIEIRGYTDNRGSRKLNERLSNDRARSVVEFLISVGVKPSQLRYKGFGPENPVATNRTADGRAQNRRIEMYRVK
jgi:outer membrane protein OmpA-like peptidoglycan-associated protein